MASTFSASVLMNDNSNIQEGEPVAARQSSGIIMIATGTTTEKTRTVSSEAGDGPWRLGAELEHPDEIFETDYFDLHGHNISGDLWLNYTCQSLEVASDILKTVIGPIICLGGILCIMISMVVLTRKSMCTSCNCYLTALAVGDLLFLIILLVRNFIESSVDCEFHVSSFRVVFFEYSIIFMDILQYLTVEVTVMLAVERYIAICHPMRSRSVCTVKRARTIIVVLVIVAFILRAPKFFEIKFVWAMGRDGEPFLVTEWVYPYDEKAYTYIVT
ncbi:FMRFamide receptor, partial [Plakobranchus ocellatus]